MSNAAATLPLTFERQAEHYDQRVFLREKRQQHWHDHSWREIADAAMRLRAGLKRRGITAGDRVAIIAENCPQWIIVDQAVLGLGAVVVPVFTTSSVGEIDHVLNDSGARLIAAFGDHLVQKVAAIHASTPAVEAIVAMHPEAASGRVDGLKLMTLAELTEAEAMPSIEARRDDLATLIYTSGTTGASKGAMLSHGNILSNCDGNARVLNLDERDLAFSFLPMAHSFERTGNYYTVMTVGGTLAFAEGLTQIAQNMLEVEPTVVLTVPRVLEIIYNRVMRTVAEASTARHKLFDLAIKTGTRAAYLRHHGRALPPYLALAMMLFRRLVFQRIRGLFGSRLRYLIAGGAPLPIEINRLLCAAEVPLVEGYGLTEASPTVACNRHGHTRVGTVGQPLYNLEVKTAADGELLVRGPNVMKGYWGRQAETDEVIDAGGWLHTGDIARIDQENYIRITDRKKEIIVLSGGKNVSPAHLEGRLQNDPFIAQACVVGDRRKHLAAIIVPNFENLGAEVNSLGIGDKPLSEVVADPRLKALFQGHIRAFNQNVSDVEAISAFTLIAQPFSQDNSELTPTLKLRRKVVQEHYRERIEAMYSG
ncbi:MAG: AMP-dependent synthetase/ligase [Candidatus Binataceae bacterium]